jgi:HEAT repeat protein
MDLVTDFAVISRLQAVLEKANATNAGISCSAESFLEKISEIAERTRVRPSAPTTIDREDNRETIVSGIDFKRFIELAVEAGLLVVSGDPLEPAFRDAFERDGHAARYLMQFLESDYMDRGLMRDRAVAALVQIGSPAIPRLTSGLGHPDSAVRLACSVALRNLKTTAVPALTQALKYGNDEVRRAAVEALMTPESSRLATEPLINLLLNDHAPLVRAAAALSLKEGGTSEGIEALVDALKDKDGLVVSMVKQVLQDLDTPLARRALEDYVAGPKRLGIPDEPRWHREEAAKQSSKPPRIFLSYPREHRIDVSKIRKLLGDAGFDVWLDSDGLLAGQQWEESLRSAVRSSDFVVGFLSRHTSDGYQVRELRMAADHSPRGRGKASPFLLPCIIDSETWSGLRLSRIRPGLRRANKCVRRFSSL